MGEGGGVPPRYGEVARAKRVTEGLTGISAVRTPVGVERHPTPSPNPSTACGGPPPRAGEER